MGIDRVGIDRLGIASIPKNLKTNQFLLIGLEMIGSPFTHISKLKSAY